MERGKGEEGVEREAEEVDTVVEREVERGREEVDRGVDRGTDEARGKEGTATVTEGEARGRAEILVAVVVVVRAGEARGKGEIVIVAVEEEGEVRVFERGREGTGARRGGVAGIFLSGFLILSLEKEEGARVAYGPFPFAYRGKEPASSIPKFGRVREMGRPSLTQRVDPGRTLA